MELDARLRTSWLGLKLQSPFVASSSGRTDSWQRVEKLAKLGVGAVVMKSVFEEQFHREVADLWSQGAQSVEGYEYLAGYVGGHRLEENISQLKRAKEVSGVPVIASINCLPGGSWQEFAKGFEEAGADALELNIFQLPVDVSKPGSEYEGQYIDTVSRVVKGVKIPVSVKIPRGFTNPLNMLWRLESAGAKGAVLYNRFTEVDVDVEKLSLRAGGILSHAEELLPTLRVVSLAQRRVKGMELGVSTGVHTARDAAKALLVGAQVAQVCTTLYRNGDEVLQQLNADLLRILDAAKLENVEAMRGRLGYTGDANPELYERVQFMRYFGGESGK